MRRCWRDPQMGAWWIGEEGWLRDHDRNGGGVAVTLLLAPRVPRDQNAI
jgi:hypothetical protein